MKDFEKKVALAVKHFWETREKQAQKQGRAAGERDRGARPAVTGGAQLDSFANVIRESLIECGIPNSTIFRKQNVVLPGFFRPTKEWDLLVVVDGTLLAILEFKSQVGPSFGNNYNNRTEEALGSATDLWTAYREGAFEHSQKPWLGYFMLLEEAKKSLTPVAVKEPHFKVFEEFRDASYAKRYELFCLKLVRERLYDATCFLLSDKEGGLAGGRFREPCQELTFRRFVESLTSRAIAFSRYRQNPSSLK